MPVKSHSPFVVYLRQDKSDISTDQVKPVNTDTTLPRIKILHYPLDYPNTSDFCDTSNICHTVVENSTMKLKVKRTPQKTAEIAPLPLENRELEAAGPGDSNLASSDKGSASSPSEKVEDVASSSYTSGSNFSWKKEFVIYKEETSDSEQSDSRKPRHLRSLDTEKDAVITVPSTSSLSPKSTDKLCKEMEEPEKLPVESFGSEATDTQTPCKIASDVSDPGTSLSSDLRLQEKDVSKGTGGDEGKTRAGQKTPDNNKVKGRGRPRKIASTELRKEITEDKEGKTTAGQEAPNKVKAGRGRPRKVASAELCTEITGEDKEGKTTAGQEAPNKVKGRGRPRKVTSAELCKEITGEDKEGKTTAGQEAPNVKAGRGRPRKVASVESCKEIKEAPEKSPVESHVGKETDILKPHEITSKELETSSSSNLELLGKDGSKETTVEQGASSKVKVGRGRPRKIASIDYANAQRKTTVGKENKFSLPPKSSVFPQLGKTISLKLKRLTKADLRKYNAEDQLKSLNEESVGNSSNFKSGEDVITDKNLPPVIAPTEESELSVASSTEIQNANSAKNDNLKKNVEKWLQTVVVPEGVDNLNESISNQPLVEDAEVIKHQVENLKRRKTSKASSDAQSSIKVISLHESLPVERRGGRKKMVPEQGSENSISSKENIPDRRNQETLCSKSSSSVESPKLVERRGREKKTIPDSVAANLNSREENVSNLGNSEDLASKSSDFESEPKHTEKRGRKKNHLSAPIGQATSSKKSLRKRETSNYSEQNEPKYTSLHDHKKIVSALIQDPVLSSEKLVERRGRKRKLPLSKTSSVISVTENDSLEPSSVKCLVPPPLPEDVKKMHCSIEMPNMTLATVSVETLFSMFNMSPIVEVERLKPIA